MLLSHRPLDREAISRMYLTLGTTQYYQAKIEAELDVMSILEIPYGRFMYDDPPPRVRKHYNKLLHSLPDLPTPHSPCTLTKSQIEIMNIFKKLYERT